MNSVEEQRSNLALSRGRLIDLQDQHSTGITDVTASMNALPQRRQGGIESIKEGRPKYCMAPAPGEQNVRVSRYFTWESSCLLVCLTLSLLILPLILPPLPPPPALLLLLPICLMVLLMLLAFMPANANEVTPLYT